MIEIAIIRKDNPVIDRGWRECIGCGFMVSAKKEYCCTACKKTPKKHILPLKTTHFMLEPVTVEEAIKRKENA